MYLYKAPASLVSEGLGKPMGNTAWWLVIYPIFFPYISTRNLISCVLKVATFSGAVVKGPHLLGSLSLQGKTEWGVGGWGVGGGEVLSQCHCEVISIFRDVKNN